MKLLLFIASLLLILSFNKLPKFNNWVYSTCIDTSHIIHVLDGSTAEWPDTIFQVDKGTSLRYAIDNDEQNLYLALRIADFRTQMKLMRQGMNLFIDIKGKKKEGRGIEFPVKSEQTYSGSGFNTQSGNQSNQEGNERGNFDKKMLRQSMALHLFVMKIFGFTDNEPVSQALQMPGSANISFIWDSSDVMHIEYLVPLAMLGDISSLHQKTISVGWQINGAESSSGNTVAFSTTSIQSRPSGTGASSRNSGRGTAANNSFSQADMGKMTSEQSFWTKYIINF